MKKLIILADLGRVRTIKVEGSSELPDEAMRLVEDETSAFDCRTSPLGDLVTDQAGRFGRGSSVGTPGGMSYGEEHDLEREIERRSIDFVAKHLDKVLDEAGTPPWILVAPASILKRLQSALSEKCRTALTETVAADLTKMSIADLTDRFLD
jgi:ATP-dependent exoDNAse (exonuclease V) alpha subunit